MEILFSLLPILYPSILLSPIYLLNSFWIYESKTYSHFRTFSKKKRIKIHTQKQNYNACPPDITTLSTLITQK